MSHASTNPEVLSVLGVPTFYCAYKGDSPLALWPLLRSEQGAVISPEHLYYFGPFWIEEPGGESATSKLRRLTDVVDALLAELPKDVQNTSFSLGPEWTDIRPFDWFRWGSDDVERFSISARYSAQLNLEGATVNDLALKFRELRRRELRRFDSGRVVIKRGLSAETLESLYVETLMRSDENPSTGSLSELAKICSLQDAGLSVGFTAVAESGEPVGCSLLLLGDGNINLVAQAVSTTSRQIGAAAALIRAGLHYGIENQFKIFDFNGANSPSRGDDKHSYGAEARLYFDLRFPRRF
jgi:hypothetical protein